MVIWSLVLSTLAEETSSVTLTGKATVTGVESEILENVLHLLGIAGKETWDETSLYRLHAQASSEITSAIEPFGYYNATITPILEISEGAWHAEYSIDLGEAVRVTQINFSWDGPGQTDPKLLEIRKRFPLSVGDPFVHSLYERGKKEFLETAQTLGYLQAAWKTHEVEVDPTKHNAVLTLAFSTGLQYRFGNVRFQNGGLQEGLLNGYVPFARGEKYTSEQVWALQEALTDSDYFSRIEPHPRLEEAQEDEVPMDVLLEPRPQSRYALGMGYGGDTGARGRAAWENRRINPEGHRLRVDLRVSQLKDSLSAEYRIPLAQPRSDYLAFTSTYLDDQAGDTVSRSLLFGVSRVKKLSENWLRTLYLDELIEKYDAGTQSSTPHLLYPGVTWLYSGTGARSLWAGPKFKYSLDVKGSPVTGISSARFVQSSVQAKGILPMGEKRRLLGRLDLGETWVEGFGNLPPTLRFFAGGDNSVRGYGYRELGPKDSTGKVVGGHYLAVASLEAEQKVTDRWSVATFYDLGNSFDHVQNHQDNSKYADLRSGAGLGVRWQSPVGPIRIDLGFALSEPGRPWRVHFNFGPDF